MMFRMSHGLTRRACALVESGAVGVEELQAAEHEADFLAHPYIGVEHIELARLRLAGRMGDHAASRRELRPGIQRRIWRPLGRASALRRAGRMRTRAAQEAAVVREDNDAADRDGID